MEAHYYHLVLTYLQAHTRLSALFIFLIAFSESLPLIGTIIPGSITMTVVGVLIGTGALPLTSSLLIASVAAFCGDFTGFLFGYHYNERLRTMWPFKKHPQWLTMGEKFFKKHGGKSIVLGRFIGPARSTVPMIAGLMKLSWLRFAAASLPSAVMWAVMYMTPGILLGALSREIPKAETTKFFLYGLGTLFVLWAIFWLIQHFFIQLTRLINHGTEKLWGYLSRKNTGRFFIRFVTNQQNHKDHHQLTLLLTSIVSGVLFLFLLMSVRIQGVLTLANRPIFYVLQSIRTDLWNKIFVVITIMGMPITILCISILLIIGLAFKKQWRAALHFIIACILTGGAIEVFKKLSHSIRPQGFEMVEKTYSFPSGHTTLSFVIFSFMAFFLTQIISKKYRWIPYTFSSLLITFVAFSRLYLGAHWFTDIIGSILLGLTILLLCIISYRRMPEIGGRLLLSTRATILLFCGSLLIPWTINIPLTFAENFYHTTPIWPKHYLLMSSWWESPLHYTPIYRDDRLGKPAQPFNVQWQGSLVKITKTLTRHSWVLVSNDHALKLNTELQRFTSLQAQYHLPLLQLLYRDKSPALFLIKHIAKENRVIELRLWESDIHFQPGNHPLWIGSVDILIPPKKLLSLKESTTITLANKGGVNELDIDANTFQKKVVTAPIDPTLKKIKKLQWDGKILLLRD